MRVESVGRARAVCQCAECAAPVAIGQAVIRAAGRVFCGVDCYLAADARDQAEAHDANATADELPGPCEGCGLHVGCQCDPHCTCADCMARHIEKLAADERNPVIDQASGRREHAGPDCDCPGCKAL